MISHKKSFLNVLLITIVSLHTVCIPVYANEQSSDSSTQTPTPQPTVENKEADVEANVENAEVDVEDEVENTEIDDSPQLSQEEKEKLENTHKVIVDALLQKGIEQLESIDFVLEHIAGRLNNKSITVAQPQKLRKSIKDLRSAINTMRSNAYVHTSHQNLVMIIHLNATLIQHIANGFEQNLANIPALDVMQIITRAQEQNSLQQLSQILQTNDSLIEYLYKQSENFGLNSFNRLFRKVEAFNKRHSVLTKAVKVAGTLGTLGYVLYKLPDSLFDPANQSDSMLEHLKKAATGQLSNEKKRKSLLSFSRLPRPTSLSTGPLFGGKLGWLGKSLYSIKKRLGSAPVIENGIITKTGTGLYGRIDTLKSGIGLSAHHLGLTTLAPIILPFIRKDIANAGNLLKGSWDFVHNKFRGGRPVTHEGFTKNTSVTFDDVVGNEHVKEALNPIIDYILDPKKFDQPGIQPEKGILLVGPPGTGKTLCAKALANEIKRRLELEGRYNDYAFIPMSASRINQLGIEYVLRTAKNAAPCVLFLDELDLIGRGLQRDRDPESLSQLLTAMSGCLEEDPENQIIILAATNKPQHLDYALTRPGRFGKIIPFELPTYAHRREYLRREFDKRCLNEEMFDLDQMAYETEGCTYDGIGTVIKNAMIYAKERHTIVSPEDFSRAINLNVHNILPTSRKLPQSELKSIAMYQASRAIVINFLQPKRVIVKVTTNPITTKVKEESIYQKNQRPQQEIMYGDIFSFLPEDALNLVDEKAKTAQIKVLIAGHVGAKIMDARAHNYRMHDNQQALKLAQELILGGFVNKGDLSHAKQDKILDQAFDLVERCRHEVGTLLQQHETAISEIGNILIADSSITGNRMREIINAHRINQILDVDTNQEENNGQNSKQ